MASPYLVYFYSIATLLLFRLIFCSHITICDESPFPELCDSNIVRKLESHESQIKASMSQAKAAWMDCLELYQDVVQHLNLSKNHLNITEVEKWLNSTLVNHKDCQNGFKDSNLSLHSKNLLFLLQNFFRTLVNLLVENKRSTSNLPMTNGRRLIQLTNEGEMIHVDLVVAQDGSGDFSTVTEAIEASETRRTGTNRFVIHVKAGVYVESVVIKSSMTNLLLIGDGIDMTIITNNKSTDQGYTTFDTATFQIRGSGFVAVGITFENTAGPDNKQAVALLSASDLSAFYRCSFKGYQDTLCLLQRRQFFRECDIYGTVDFIFGDAAAVLQHCNIYLRQPVNGQENTITAQGRSDSSSGSGFVIHNSQIYPAPELAQANASFRTFLGRPWRDYSRVVFVKCLFDAFIDPQGWMPYRGTAAFETVYYAEYLNSGMGADTGDRVKWPGYHVLTTEVEAEQFSVGSFLAGDSWIPQTGVPYYSRI